MIIQYPQVVEIYDLDASANLKRANTRGFVLTDDNVMIAGTIVLGQTAQKGDLRPIGFTSRTIAPASWPRFSKESRETFITSAAIAKGRTSKP